MKLKKVVCLGISVIMTMSLFAGCANNGGKNEVGDKFIIGGLGPLTGDAASYGTSVKQGAEIAIEEINKAGGIKVGDKTVPIELIFEDDMASESTVKTAYNNLMDKNMNVLLGTVTSGACIAIVDDTKKDGILQITPSGSAMDCTKNDNNFRLCFTDPLQGKTMAEFAVNELKYKKIAVIFNNSDDYSKGMKTAFVDEVKKLGGEIVAEEAFVKGDVDFNTQLTKIKGTEAQCIFAPIYYNEASSILNQASQKGIKLPFLGGDGWDGILAQLDDKSVAEGTIFLSPFLATDPDEKIQAFVKAYQAAYKDVPNQFAADGYDTVYVIKAAVEKAKSVDIEELKTAMTEIEVSGLTGDVKFSKDGEPDKKATFVEIKNGEYTAR